MPTDKRRQSQPITPDKPAQQMYDRVRHDGASRHRPNFFNAAVRSPTKPAQGRVTVSARATNTTSYPDAACRLSRSSAAARNRRLARLRLTALPTFLLAVKPKRTATLPPAGRCRSSCLRTCKINPGATCLRLVPATAKNSGRRSKRPTRARLMRATRRSSAGRSSNEAMARSRRREIVSGAENLAALSATARDNLAAGGGGHTGAEAVAAGADDLAGLESALHGTLLHVYGQK
jgi:hypothetical protein